MMISKFIEKPPNFIGKEQDKKLWYNLLIDFRSLQTPCFDSKASNYKNKSETVTYFQNLS